MNRLVDDPADAGCRRCARPLRADYERLFDHAVGVALDHTQTREVHVRRKARANARAEAEAELAGTFRASSTQPEASAGSSGSSSRPRPRSSSGSARDERCVSRRRRAASPRRCRAGRFVGSTDISIRPPRLRLLSCGVLLDDHRAVAPRPSALPLPGRGDREVVSRKSVTIVGDLLGVAGEVVAVAEAETGALAVEQLLEAAADDGLGEVDEGVVGGRRRGRSRSSGRSAGPARRASRRQTPSGTARASWPRPRSRTARRSRAAPRRGARTARAAACGGWWRRRRPAAAVGCWRRPGHRAARPGRAGRRASRTGTPRSSRPG